MMNVTPRISRRRSTSPSPVSPEKQLRPQPGSQKHASSSEKNRHIDNRPRVMTWDTSDGSPMPAEGILRDFDMNLKYGPCCSLTREERWNRAQKLGLHPPREVLNLITATKNNESVLDLHLRQIVS